MSNMRKAITTETRQKVLDMYMAGYKGEEILAATNIGSRKTLYKIIRELGIKKDRREDPTLQSIVVKIPADLAAKISGQDVSALFAEFLKTKLPYSQNEGGSKKQQKQQTNLPYSETEGTSKDSAQQHENKQQHNTSTEAEKTVTAQSETPYSQNDGSDDTIECTVRYIDKYGDCIARRSLITVSDESIITKQVKCMASSDTILSSAETATVDINGIQMQIAL